MKFRLEVTLVYQGTQPGNMRASPSTAAHDRQETVARRKLGGHQTPFTTAREMEGGSRLASLGAYRPSTEISPQVVRDVPSAL
jgi:hypothetical protein